MAVNGQRLLESEDRGFNIKVIDFLYEIVLCKYGINNWNEKRKGARNNRVCCALYWRRNRLSQQSLKESIHSPVTVWGSGSQRSFRNPCNLVLWIPLRFHLIVLSQYLRTVEWILLFL